MQITDQRGSIVPLGVGVMIILLIAVMGSINISYLVGKRFQLQSELDVLALRLVQQVDYDGYFEHGFTSDLNFDYDLIDSELATANQTGALGICREKINMAIAGLGIDLALACPIRLPVVIPGLPERVILELGASARLAQAAG